MGKAAEWWRADGAGGAGESSEQGAGEQGGQGRNGGADGGNLQEESRSLSARILLMARPRAPPRRYGCGVAQTSAVWPSGSTARCANDTLCIVAAPHKRVGVAGLEETAISRKSPLKSSRTFSLGSPPPSWVSPGSAAPGQWAQQPIARDVCLPRLPAFPSAWDSRVSDVVGCAVVMQCMVSVIQSFERSLVS